MFAIISLVLGVVLVMLLFHIKSLNKDFKYEKEKLKDDYDISLAILSDKLAKKENLNMDLQLKVNKLTQELEEHKNVQTSRIVTEVKDKTTKPKTTRAKTTKNKDSE